MRRAGTSLMRSSLTPSSAAQSLRKVLADEMGMRQTGHSFRCCNAILMHAMQNRCLQRVTIGVWQKSQQIGHRSASSARFPVARVAMMYGFGRLAFAVTTGNRCSSNSYL